MTTRRMKGPFGSAPIVFVILTVVLATAGLIWAHWYTSLRVDANIHTGNVGMEWSGAWTNDDGWVNDVGWDGEDDGENGLFSHWDDSSSLDPADFGVARYDKDVARCTAGGGGDYLDISIENAYPSYHCLVQAPLHNFGSVPIKALPGTWTMEAGYHHCEWYLNDSEGQMLPRSGDEISEFVDLNENGVFDDIDVRVSWDEMGPFADVDFDGVFNNGDRRIYEDCYLVGHELAAQRLPDGGIAWGHYDEADEFVAEVTGFIPSPFRCGTQIDPGFESAVEFGFHVEQPAIQNGTYRLTMAQDFVNWNEFDEGWCRE